MVTRRRRGQNLPQGNEISGEKSCSFKMNESLYLRVDAYVTSPNAIVKSKSALIETAIIEFLDREEPIAKEIEKLRNKLEKRFK